MSDIRSEQKVGFPTHEQAALWASQFSEKILNQVFYVVGFSNGEFIREMLKVLDATNTVIVYEPFVGNYNFVKEKSDITDILEDSRFMIYVSENEEKELIETIATVVNYDAFGRTKLILLPGYEACSSILLDIKSALEYQTRMLAFEKITDIALAEKVRTNIVKNFPSVIRERSINQLLETLNSIDKKNIPAIIISAGPSLDKNIYEIKKAEGHAFIIAVDTALKAVLRAGINPDITVCVDPRKELVLFEHDKIKNIPAIFTMDIPDKIVSEHTSPMFFAGYGLNDLSDAFYKKYDDTIYEVLEAGGSVANTAFSAARKLGFKTIIFVGQDLAFTDGRGHTGAAYDDEKKNANDTVNGVIVCEVPGIYGGMVKTEIRMKSYLEWFEKEIHLHPEITVIDATEGGALIKGTKIMTLADAIKENCVESVDWSEIISEIPPLYSKEEQEEIRSELRAIDESLDDLKKVLEDGITSYNKLIYAVKQNNQALMNAALNELKTVNDIDNINPLMQLIHHYCIREEYAAKDALKNDDGSSIDVAVDNGKKLLQAYITGVDNMKKDTYLLKDRL